MGIWDIYAIYGPHWHISRASSNFSWKRQCLNMSWSILMRGNGGDISDVIFLGGMTHP